MIYLDEAATSKPKQEVIEAILPYFKDKWYNPSSLYKPATDVKKDVDNARKVVANFINANPEEIFFTSGGSESNCWVIQGFINYCVREGVKPIIITSNIEHKSILKCIDDFRVDVCFIGVNKQGVVDKDRLRTILKNNTVRDLKYKRILVSIQYANNEIGVVQNISEIAKIVHRYNAILHTDAVQAFARIPIDVKDGIDLLSASGHKIGTPKGIGLLYKREGIKIKPLIYGSQMDGMRGGTENVPYIIGFAKAVELTNTDFKKRVHQNNIRNYFIAKLKQRFKCKINGSEHHRLPNNINVTFPQNISGEALIYMLDMCGIYISAGSACNSYSSQPSHVLKAIGLSDEEIMRTIRITLPDNITLNDIDRVVYEMEKQIKLLTIKS